METQLSVTIKATVGSEGHNSSTATFTEHLQGQITFKQGQKAVYGIFHFRKPIPIGTRPQTVRTEISHLQLI